jgi:hypothetical protein
MDQTARDEFTRSQSTCTYFACSSAKPEGEDEPGNNSPPEVKWHFMRVQGTEFDWRWLKDWMQVTRPQLTRKEVVCGMIEAAGWVEYEWAELGLTH